MSRDPGRVPLRAVLFDMDGTLTDSEKLWTIALERLAVELGGTMSAQARAAMVGKPIGPAIALLHADLGIERDAAASTARLMELTGEVFRAGMPWRPGARELLADVRAAGLATALVTATYRSLVEIALETLGRDNFDVTVCGDEVARGKPHPDPYLRAMELLDVAAPNSLAVEDSPTGTRAAELAGVAVLVVPSEVPVPPGPARAFAPTLVSMTAGSLRTIHAEFGAGDWVGVQS
ncbi:HAD superfamily hydrolase (TIGR01509 family) [Nakamurella flavida]|nr:HAD family phosphatase [Nakamurella flavida]MDP9776830.1 HAD superfamily hydrolase (TIGR01509 family) [Nakamurella flavida]